MSIIYCEDCGTDIDTDFEAEHFEDHKPGDPLMADYMAGAKEIQALQAIERRQLTPAELTVLKLRAAGLSDAETARALGLSRQRVHMIRGKAAQKRGDIFFKIPKSGKSEGKGA